MLKCFFDLLFVIFIKNLFDKLASIVKKSNKKPVTLVYFKVCLTQRKIGMPQKQISDLWTPTKRCLK